MFTWIEKVIPQPPETPTKRAPDGQDGSEPPQSAAQNPLEKDTQKLSCVGKESSRAAELKIQEAAQESEKSAGGVLTWLAQGLGRVVPQPVDSPTLIRANKENEQPEQKQKEVSETVEKRTENGPTSQTESTSTAVLSWLSQGLEKVVPQPAWSHRPSVSAASEAPCVSVVSVQQTVAAPEKSIEMEEAVVAPPSPADTPVPASIAVSLPVPIEVQPVTSIDPETSPPEKGSGAGVLNWLMQGLGKVVPQPEPVSAAPHEVQEEKPKEEPPAPVTRKDSKGSADTGVLSWITQGLEKVIPQPVNAAKQDSQTALGCPVEQRGVGIKYP